MAYNVASALRQAYGSTISVLDSFERVVLIASVLTMALNNIANVVGRALFNQSLFFSEELNSILIILITFAGTSYAARKASHIRMTALLDTLSESHKKVIIVIISFGTAICMGMMAFFSVEYIAWIIPKGKVYPALQIPVYISYLWVPVSLILTALEYFSTGLKNLQSSETFISSNVTGDGYAQCNEEI